MAARDTVTTPDLEAGNAGEHSLAKDALQSANLEKPLTLNRKRSGWFGSAREALSKGALQAKGIVDSIRGATQINSEERPTSRLEDVHTEQHSFSPRSAMTSFRQHVHIGGSKSKQKRGALADFCDNVTRDGAADSPQKDTPTKDTMSSPGGLVRKLSLGRNLVGSIRSMTTKHTRSPPTKERLDEVISPPNSPPASSPTAAPSLTVDIGSGEELLPEGFGRVGFKRRGASSFARPTITISPERMSDTSVCVSPPHDGIDPLKDVIVSPISSEDLDMTSDDNTLEDISEVFERGVHAKESKSLRRMISLDAMAERCVSTPDSGSLAEYTSSRKVSQIYSSIRPSSASGMIFRLGDMDPPILQPRRSQVPTVLLDSQRDGRWRSDDPFAPATPSIKLHGPEIELPFRPKIAPQKPAKEQDLDAQADLSSLDGHVFTSRSAAIISSSSPEQHRLSPAEKHRSMVVEVLEIEEKDGELDSDEESSSKESSPGRPIPNSPTDSNCGVISELWNRLCLERAESIFSEKIEHEGSDCPSNMADTCSPQHKATSLPIHTTTPLSEKSDGSEGAMYDAMVDSYDLQVALGGVDIVCDEKLRAWLDESDDEDENESTAFSPSTIKSCEQNRLMDDVDSDTSESVNASSVLKTASRESVLETMSQEIEDSLDEALDMYRSYSAESDAETAKALLNAMKSPTGPDLTKSGPSTSRKPLPVRYRSVRGRK